MVSICCIFNIICSTQDCKAQETKNPIVLSFVKNNDSIKASEMYFNVLKIINKSTNSISGKVSFNGPENWKIISFSENETILLPGDSVSVPVRVSPTADALGGITYILSASFRTNERQITTSTYVTIPSKPKWDFIINKSNLYFTEDSPNASFEVKISNKGNTNELIKIHLKIGKLLMFLNNTSNELVEFVNLPAFKDTTITHTVAYQTKLSYAEKSRYMNNWKESSVQAFASNDLTERSATILFHQMNSSYYNLRAENSSPLNFDYQIYNLMSSQKPSSNLRIYGSVLFPQNREIDYMGGVQNLSIGGGSNTNFDFNRQLFYSLLYLDNRNKIELGYNVNGGNLHTINGRGISGSYKINKKSKLSYALTQNPYSLTIGEYAGLSTSLKGIGLNTGLTHESSSIAKYDATSGLIGTGFSLFTHHSFSVQFLGSQSRYNLLPGKDTTVLGYSYVIGYTIRYKKFDLMLNDLNSTHNYIRNSGQQQFTLDSKYRLTDRIIFSLYGNQQNYAATWYPNNFYHPAGMNSTDYARFTTSISSGNVEYQFGPNYISSGRVLYNSLTGYNTDYQTYQPGLWASTTFRLNGNRSITPNFAISNLSFQYKTNDPASSNYSSDKNIYYTVGLNYFDSNWRVNAYYSSGSVSDLYRSVQIDVAPVVSSSIQFRPSYENYFFNRTVKISAYLNYGYYMPSGRENISYNVRYDQFLKHGWAFSVSGFMYDNSVVDPNQGRIDTKDFNFTVGISKSFNIQQPRLKYYKFKTVFFNDLDGNHIKSDNEPPVSNVLVNIQKNRSVSTGLSNIPETELLSDVNGGISFENLPKDNYKLTFTPLTNLQSLYFVNGANQAYSNDKDRTLYVPLSESYRVKGKLVVVRDPNSSEGKIDLSSIRITATGMKGETYSTLTDNFGFYVLNVPNADKYKVHVNNVFGEQFNIDTNEMEVQFTKNKAINLDFTFIEKIRKVNFDEGNEIFKFSSISAPSETKATTEAPIAQIIPVENTPAFAIQLGAIKSYRNPSFYNNKFKIKGEVLYLEKDGMFKYYTGSYATLKEARVAITKLGYSGLTPVAVDFSMLKRATPAAIVKSTIPNPVKVDVVAQDGNPATYSIQLDALKSYREPAFYKTRFKLKGEVLYLEQGGEYKYYTGVYSSLEAAKADIVKLGLKGFPVVVDRSLLKAGIPLKHAPVVTKPDKTLPISPVKDQSGTTPLISNDQKNETGKTYSVQLDVLKTFQDPSYYKIKYNLPNDVLWSEKDGEFKYYTGIYPTIEAADADILRYGMAGYIVPVDRSQLKKGNTYEKIQDYAIQLEVSRKIMDTAILRFKYKIKGDVMYFERDGQFIYVTGDYPNIEKAKADMVKLGIKGTVIVVKKTSLKSK